MKTPDEIKKGINCCYGHPFVMECDECPYMSELDIERDCEFDLVNDIYAYIQQIEARIDTLTAKAVLFDEAVALGKKYKRERDAAVEQLRKGGRACSTCKFSEDIPENDKICEECRLTGTKLLYSNWEWVGPQEVE